MPMGCDLLGLVGSDRRGGPPSGRRRRPSPGADGSATKKVVPTPGGRLQPDPPAVPLDHPPDQGQPDPLALGGAGVEVG